MRPDDHFKAHVDLVARLALKLKRQLGLSLDERELRAWGYQGLMEAKHRYRSDRGAQFSTFAYYRIRGAMLDGIRKQGWAGRRTYARIKAVETGDRLAEQHAPSSGKRARAERSTRAADIDGILGGIGTAYLLSSVGLSDGLEDTSPETLFAAAEHCQAVRAQLHRLPTRERTLLEAVYFEGATLEEAGAKLGISKSWASRVNAKALARLRRNLTGLGA